MKIVHRGNMVSLGENGSCIMIGPHWPMTVCTYLLICTPSILFFAFVAPTRATWETLLSSVLFALTVISFTVTALKDPGVCPREEALDVEDAGISFEPSPTPSSTGSFKRRRRKFCKHCNVAQPINSVHCPDCDVCVLDLDHHCPWTGKCIGKGNLAFFNSFLLCLLALAVTLIVVTVQYFSDTG